MQGTGILLSEDDTVYEGEFSDNWTLSGKVGIAVVACKLLPSQKFGSRWILVNFIYYLL